MEKKFIATGKDFDTLRNKAREMGVQCAIVLHIRIIAYCYSFHITTNYRTVPNPNIVAYFNISATLDEYKTNPGIVIQSSKGTAIKAAADGVITKITQDDELGVVISQAVGNGQFKILTVQLTITVKKIF